MAEIITITHTHTHTRTRQTHTMCSSRQVKVKQTEYTAVHQIDYIVLNDLMADYQLAFKVWQKFSLS